MKDRTTKEAFWSGVQEDFARLRAGPKAWQAYVDEAAFWEATGGDGLENEPPYYSPEELTDRKDSQPKRVAPNIGE